jgi:penicillin-binding protein 2
VLVENGGFGAAAAAPIARKVIDAYLLGADAPADPKKPTVPATLGGGSAAPPAPAAGAPTGPSPAITAHAATTAATGAAPL